MAINDITIEDNIIYKEGLNGSQKAIGYAMIPTGGITGQGLVKSSDEDYAIEWGDTSGGVDSVNGKTGEVVLKTDDIAEGATNEYYTEDKVTANTSVAANTLKLEGIENFAEVNTINTATAGEPSGSDLVLNVVSLTQAEYDAGTPVATTFYIITT